MAASGPFKLKFGAPSATGRLGLAAKNIGMFLLALAVTAGLGTALKSCAGGANASGGYYLEAREALKAGDTITPENVVWRSAQGRRLDGAFQSADRSGEGVFGQRLIRPVLAGKPVPSASLAPGGSAAGLALAQGEVAFVLAGVETEAVSGFVRTGDSVNVIAVLGTGRLSASVDPSVGTVVRSARVLAVRPAASSRRGAGSTLAISLTPEEAEDLAAWRHTGRLIVALAGPDDGYGDDEVNWRPLFEDTVEQDPSLNATEDYATPVWDGPAPSAEVETEEAVEAGPSVEIIGPSGVQSRPVQ